MDTEQRRRAIPVAGRPGRRGATSTRRPSGLEQPARHPLARGTWVAAGVFVLSTAALLALDATTGPSHGGTVLPAVERLDGAVARFLADGRLRVRAAENLASLAGLGYRVLWVPCALVLLWFARWRELAVYLGTISVVAALAQAGAGETGLARAVRTGITGSDRAVLPPGWPVVVVSAIATGTLLALVPGGRPRRWGWGIVLVGITTAAIVRVAVGLDSASATVASCGLGCSAVVLAFRVLAPESEFPVTYHRDVKAHLRLDRPRKDRVLAAVRDQLGVAAIDLTPYRLDGSAGSTPCRLSVAEGEPRELFGKLYATRHLRSDRWYKLARLLRYGRLEDEAPFSSVRRLVEHEDYMLRLLRDGGVRVPEPWGVVEVVTGREYLLVTELVPDAVEILDSGVPDEVIADALLQVRRLWTAGAAHRDVKPSNVLARGKDVYLVDVSFGELRPSGWRQAADLANMMLTLGLVAGPERVLRQASAQFGHDELADAFAATSSLTVPRQLRRLIDASGVDLVAGFRALLPPRKRIRVQRWSVRRLLLAAGTLGGVLASGLVVVLNLRAGGLL